MIREHLISNPYDDFDDDFPGDDFPGDQPTQALPPKAKPPRFPLMQFQALQPNADPHYLVKWLVPRGGLTVVWGPPKCGKSYWTFDLAMHVVLGRRYRGRPTLEGAVVYCAFEGAEGFKARAEAYRRRHLAAHSGPVPFWLMATPLNLARDHRALVQDIRSQLPGTIPLLVVLDTLNRSLGGSESKDEDMSAYVQAADAIRNAFGCAVIVVHHCGVDASRPRGHTSLAGAVDAQLAVRRDGGNTIVVTVEHMKDGPDGETILSRLEVVDLGADADGDPITACIIVPVEGTGRPVDREPRLTKGARLALNALHEAITAHGEVPPANNHIPALRQAVSIKLWRDFAFRRGICQSEERRARDQAFQRAMTALLDAKVVATWDPYVWLCE